MTIPRTTLSVLIGSLCVISLTRSPMPLFVSPLCLLSYYSFPCLFLPGSCVKPVCLSLRFLFYFDSHSSCVQCVQFCHCGKNKLSSKTDFSVFLLKFFKGLCKEINTAWTGFAPALTKRQNYNSSFIDIMWIKSLSIQCLGVNSHQHLGTSLIMKCFPVFIHSFFVQKKLQLHIKSKQWLDEVKHKFSIIFFMFSFFPV